MGVRQIAESVYNSLAHISGLEEREKVADLALPVDHTEKQKTFGDYELEDLIRTMKKNGATEAQIADAMALQRKGDEVINPLDETKDYRGRRT